MRVNGHAKRSRKRSLITGGAGFVGSHLAEVLLDRGDDVTVLDNLSTGSVDNIEHLQGDARFAFHVGDIRDRELVDELVAGADVVFHLGAAVGVKLILDDPIESLHTNVFGTETVVSAAAKYGKKVLLASTSEVYGKVAKIPQHEDDDIILGPTSYSRWSYAAAKMLDEFIGLAHARRGVPVVCFRLFNTVGPRQTGAYGMVVPRFVSAAVHGRPVEVYGDGSQSRCFLHVEDAVEAIVRLETNDRAIGEVFNIGSTESVTILDLARRVLSEAGADRKLITFRPYAEAYPDGGFEEIQRRQPDISKIRGVTRWHPKRRLDHIIRDVIAEHAVVTAPGEVEMPVVAIA